MSYFPLFLDMKSLKILVVGGGNIAFEKLEKLLDFSSSIAIVALEVSQKVEDLSKEHNLTFHRRAYIKDESLDYDIVIVATDTQILHKQIYLETRKSKTFVNSVDNVEYCDFIFPSYIKEDDLIIAFSTSGASPAFAKEIKLYIKKIIPKDIGKFLKKMKFLRKSMPKGKDRMLHFDILVKEYFKKNFK